MQLGDFIKMLQDAGLPMTYEVIVGGRRDPRIVEPLPRDMLPPETIFIDGMQEAGFEPLREIDPDGPSSLQFIGGQTAPPGPPPEPEEWNDPDDDFDDDEEDHETDWVPDDPNMP